jgi:hypothetical protein
MYQASGQGYFAVKVINSGPPEICPDIFFSAPFELSEAFVLSRGRSLGQGRQETVNGGNNQSNYHDFFQGVVFHLDLLFNFFCPQAAPGKDANPVPEPLT